MQELRAVRECEELRSLGDAVRWLYDNTVQGAVKKAQEEAHE